MADISQVKLPDGTTYNLKDSYVRTNYRALSNNDFDTINVTELNGGDAIFTGAVRFTNKVFGDNNTTYSLSASGESVVLTGSDSSSKSVSLGTQLLPNLPVWTANPTDDAYLIRRDNGGSNDYGQVKFSTVWNYIKSKADSTYVTKSDIPTVLGTKSYGVSTDQSSKKIKIKINPKNGWMLCFVVTLYQSYEATKIMISGYNYGNNHWYAPTARIISSTKSTGTNIYFGYDADYELWVGFDGAGYTGITIDSVTNGYSQISNYQDMFTISFEDTLTTLQETSVRYRPWYKNETVDNAVNATSATTASKLGSSNVGSATQPIYLSAGTATACTYTLGKSVPSDAKFTDHYAWTDITDKPSTFTPSTHYHYELKTIGDQRTTSTTPNTYSDRLIFQGLKTQSYIGNPGGTSGYSYLLGLRGWGDSSGGDAHELAFNNNGIYYRHGATTTWGDWVKIFTSADTYTGTLTSSQVTTALGYTPTANTGTITSVKTTAGTHTTINVSSGAANFNVPTKTSHLTNDSGFVTTDTKNTAGSTDTSSKIYLIGATSQAANPQTYSDNEVYVTSGVLTTKSVQVGGGSATMEYSATTKSINFVFAS